MGSPQIPGMCTCHTTRNRPSSCLTSMVSDRAELRALFACSHAALNDATAEGKGGGGAACSSSSPGKMRMGMSGNAFIVQSVFKNASIPVVFRNELRVEGDVKAINVRVDSLTVKGQDVATKVIDSITQLARTTQCVECELQSCTAGRASLACSCPANGCGRSRNLLMLTYTNIFSFAEKTF